MRFSLTVLVLTLVSWANAVPEEHDYCIIGAGPGGIQAGYFFEKFELDFVILEKSGSVGSFFRKYPRHRKLLSINKRHVDEGFASQIPKNEVHERYDWNSLLSDDEHLRMRYYSKKYYPDADELADYLQDFATKTNISSKILFNTKVTKVTRPNDGPEGSTPDRSFLLLFSTRQPMRCKRILVGTGRSVPHLPYYVYGMEHTIGYEQVSTNPEDFADKRVLILGNGNSAFEVSKVAYPEAVRVDIAARNPTRLAFQTHYPGDVRAFNLGPGENHQLKLGDGVISGPLFGSMILKLPSGRLLYIWQRPVERRVETTPLDERFLENILAQVDEETTTPAAMNWIQEMMAVIPSLTPTPRADLEWGVGSWPLRKPYDMIVRCLGFEMDLSIYDDDTRPDIDSLKNGLPATTPFYESTNIPGMFFVGDLMHGRDFKKSSGGEIRGFRYLVKSLANHLMFVYHSRVWPFRVVPVPKEAVEANSVGQRGEIFATSFAQMLSNRASATTALQHMNGALSDVIMFICGTPEDGGRTIRWFHEIPTHGMAQFDYGPGVTFQAVTLSFGNDELSSQPGADVFSPPNKKELPLLNHPIVRYYPDIRQGIGSFTMAFHMLDDAFDEWLILRSSVLTMAEWFRFGIFPEAIDQSPNQCLGQGEMGEVLAPRMTIQQSKGEGQRFATVAEEMDTARRVQGLLRITASHMHNITMALDGKQERADMMSGLARKFSLEFAHRIQRLSQGLPPVFFGNSAQETSANTYPGQQAHPGHYANAGPSGMERRTMESTRSSPGADSSASGGVGHQHQQRQHQQQREGEQRPPSLISSREGYRRPKSARG